MTKSKVVICPYCGDTQPANDRCRSCAGLFEPLSRQATHNEMGPWYIRNEMRPFQPGCSYETLIKLIERGQITRTTIIRGPTTKQFWTIARRVPGVAHLLGYCHSCDASVDVGDHGCHACGVPFGAYLDRNYLGLPEIRPLPWDAPLDEEGRQHEPPSSRTIDFRRAAEPLGISSFASDTELRSGQHAVGGAGGLGSLGLGAGGGAAGGFGFVPVAGAGSTFVAPRAQGVMTASQMAGSADDTSAAAIAGRAAQRRMQQQQRTIRFLTIAVLVLVVAAGTAFIIALTQSQPRAGTTEESKNVPAAPASQSQGAAETVQIPANGGNAETESASQPSDQQPIDFEAQLQQAREFIDAGLDKSRPLRERIAAYEKAQAILNEIGSQAADQSLQSDIRRLSEQVERDLYALQVEQLTREPE